MKAITLLRILSAASCLTLASCAGLWPYGNSTDASERNGSGYSLDNPASGQGRYMAGADAATTPGAPVDPNAVAGPVAPGTAPVPGAPPPIPPVPGTVTPPVAPPTTIAPPPAPAPTPTAAPTYGTPVPGRRGFVYPPGVESKPENMVDVRDFTPGQKVRDPRTGKIFLVP